MSTETIAILRAISDQIGDAISDAKLTIEPKVLAYEETSNWKDRDKRTYDGPSVFDDKRKVTKYWPELVPLAKLQDRVQQYIADVQGPR